MSALLITAFGCPRGGAATGSAGTSSASPSGAAKPKTVFFGSGSRSASGTLLQGWGPARGETPARSEEAMPRLPPSPFHWPKPGHHGAGRAG